MGPLVSLEQQRRVERYIGIGCEEGAVVAYEGNRPTDARLAHGYFVPPVIFEARSNELRISREEIFGPVMTVLPFTDIDEVVELANDTEYGLAAAIWTRDISKALRTAKAIRAGVVWINDSQPAPSESLWGGYKQSGIGRELGPYALDAYLEKKQIYISL
jgi:acyl-CoA reductase-like NAD-dependent aldehyde dehydrogenase